MSLEEWEKHIRHTHAEMTGKAWCGETLQPFDFTFENIDHAAYNNMNDGRLLPCPNCAAEVVKVLEKR